MTSLGDALRAVAGRQEPASTPSGPRLRKGVVASVSGGVAQVTIDGEDVPVDLLGHHSVLAGNVVWVLVQGPVLVMLGKVVP